MDWLDWLKRIVEEHGAGEYIVNVGVDGSVFVKRPQKPLRFDWQPDITESNHERTDQRRRSVPASTSGTIR